MAKNSEKYQVICTRVGLTRDSWALKRFMDDCVDHHMDDQPGKLVALRLTEYYELLEKLKVLPGGLAMITPFPGMEALQAMQWQQGNGNAASISRSDAPEAKDDEEDEQSSTAVTNVDDSIEDDVDNQWN